MILSIHHLGHLYNSDSVIGWAIRSYTNNKKYGYIGKSLVLGRSFSVCLKPRGRGNGHVKIESQIGPCIKSERIKNV